MASKKEVDPYIEDWADEIAGWMREQITEYYGKQGKKVVFTADIKGETKKVAAKKQNQKGNDFAKDLAQKAVDSRFP